VGYLLYGVIGDAGVLAELRHPSMYPMRPLHCGLGLCLVRTEVVKDEPPAEIADALMYLTEPVAGYAETLSQRTPVIYVAADFFGGIGDQAACGWADGRLAFGPQQSHHDERPEAARGLFRRPREPTGAIDAALEWLGVERPRRMDRFEVVGLGERHDWEHERMEGGAAR